MNDENVPRKFDKKITLLEQCLNLITQFKYMTEFQCISFKQRTSRPEITAALANFSSRVHEPELIYTLAYLISVKFVKITRVVVQVTFFLALNVAA